jgi:hypothetical protein
MFGRHAWYEVGLEQLRLHQKEKAAGSLHTALATEQGLNGDASPYAAADHLALSRLH